MMRDWEVVTVRTIDEAADAGSGMAVALIDLGDTGRGVELADQLHGRGVTIPAVVIGDVPVEHPRVTVLVRPFSLEDLGGTVRKASERPATPPTLEPAPPESTGAIATPRDAIAAPPAPERPAARSGAGVSASAAAPVPKTEPEDRPSPGRRAGLSVVRPEPERQAPAEEAAEEPVEEPVEEPITPPIVGEPVVEEEPAPEPPAEGTTAKAIEAELAAYAPPESPTPAVAPSTPATSPAAPAARVEEESQQGRRRLRRRPARPMQTVESAEPQLVRRLKGAAGHLRDVASLLEELPFLNDLRAMAEALVSELESQFDAQVMSVFAKGESGYQAIAHRGLSRVEAGMVVPETQPLFSDVLRTREGILIQPVDLAQGLVAGIGGARTEAIMACPAVFGGDVVAIVVLGGDRLADTDLDRLSDLAAEAAPGLAVAHLLQRLHGESGSG